MAAPAGRRDAARRPLPALHRLRDRPRPRRHLVGARRPHPGAVRRRLRAGEPRRHLAIFSDLYAETHVHRLAGFFRPFRDALQGLADDPRRPRRHPDARAAQRDLFRARLHRPLSRLHPARGRGPDRRERPGHGPHRRRPPAGQRALAPPRRRLRRPARARRRLAPRHPGLVGALRQGSVTLGQRARLRHPRDPGAARLPAAHRRGPARRAADPAEHRHLVVRPAGRARARPRQHRPDDDRPGALHPAAVRARRRHRPRQPVPRQGPRRFDAWLEADGAEPRRPGGGDALHHPGLVDGACCRGR